MKSLSLTCGFALVRFRRGRGAYPLVALGLALASTSPASAEIIFIDPGNVTASSEIETCCGDRDPADVVNESGLFGGQHDVDPGNMWLSRGTGFGGDDLDPWVLFDLGDVYTISSFRVWNYNEVAPSFPARGVNAVTIEYGATPALGSSVPGITNFTIAPGTDGYAGEEFSDFPPFAARYIKFDIDSNHGGDNNFYGLSEVQFDGVLSGVVVSANTFLTSASAGVDIGTLETPPGSDADSFTYALAGGEGDADNDKFQIAGDKLQVGAHDFSGASDGDEFSVRVRSTGAPSGDEFESVLILVAVADSDADQLPDVWEQQWAGDDNLGALSGLDDADADGDTLSDLDEYNLREQFPALDPTEADSDGDTLIDGEELAGAGARPVTDPTNPDTDGDSLSDGVETNTGILNGAADTGSNPTTVDTDGDGHDDDVELREGSDPNNPNSIPRTILIVIDPANVTASSEIETCCADRDPADLVNGSGLVDGLHDVDPGNMWLSKGGDFGGDDLDPWVLFDLGDVYTITSFRVWNYNEVAPPFPPRGVNDVTIQYGLTPDLGSTVPGITNFTIAPGTDGYEGEEFHSFPAFSARYIKFDIDSNHGGDNNFYGLSEVQFKGRLGGLSDIQLEIDRVGDDLVIKWPSTQGNLYSLRSVIDPATADPKDWPIYDGNTDIEATPETNTLTIPLPPEPERFFVIEEFLAPPVAVLSDDFESGIGDWTTGSDGAAGTEWQLGIPANAGPFAANSPLNCFGTNILGDYELEAEVWLRSPPIDLTLAGSATLNYSQYKDIEEGFDFGSIRILDAADDSELAILDPRIDGTTPDWEQVSHAIPAEGLGKVITVEFRFESDDIGNFAGWYLDDVEVTVP